MFDALAANLSAENFYQGRMGQGTPAFSADTEAPEIAASEGLEFIRIWPENVYAVRSIGTCTDTDLLIPDTHDGIPVTIIETGAFWDCTALTSITYEGTTTSWNKISLGADWIKGATALTRII